MHYYLEIDLLKEPIGKQDQYAAAYGGFNIFQFNEDDTVDVEPVLIGYDKKNELEDHMLLFYTGITRDASSVLVDQLTKINDNFDIYCKMADSVDNFKDKLVSGDIKGMANMLHEGWLSKKSLGDNVSNDLIDRLYQTCISAGAWGGKILGAGGGGCMFLLASPDNHQNIREKMYQIAKENSLENFKEIPIKFTQSGADVLFNSKFN